MQSSLTVIIPVYNDSANLAACYRALVASTRRPDQIIVVDDGSTESLPTPPSTLPVQVMRFGAVPQSSAAARNYGLRVAWGDLIVSVDSDVAVHPDALERLERLMQAHPEVAAAFGSYDDAPADPHWISRFKNLFHHWVHQHASAEAGTFWTGLGVIRRDAIEQMGGYDTSADTVRDIELGMRMREAGLRILLAPEIQGTHLKRWTLPRMLRSDIMDRATPWTRMIVRARKLPADLNLTTGSRWSAALVWLVVLLVAAALWQPWALAGALAALLSVVALNRDLYAFLFAHGGPFFGVGAVALHVLYLLYSSATFVVVGLHTLWREQRNTAAKRG
jgi:GT2 family glycosyltransferase